MGLIFRKTKKLFSRTSIAKSKFNTKTLNFKNIFEAYPPINSGYHFGARLVLKEDYIFASLGERGKGMISQDGMKHPGSIIRIFNDGRIPSNNPGLVKKSIGCLKYIRLDLEIHKDLSYLL